MSIIAVPLKSLENILINYIREADFDELGRIAGEMLGGKCWYWAGEDDEFHFQPNENYTGDLNNFEEI